MRQDRSYRGWIAAFSVASIITATLIYVEKYVALPGEDFWALARRVSTQVAKKSPGRGIILTEDPGLAGTSPVSPNHLTSVQRRKGAQTDSVELMRRPPELASNVYLHEPLTSEDFVSLPLTNRTSGLNALLASMDQALESPMATVSLQTQQASESAAVETTTDFPSKRFDSLQSPSELVGKMPTPSRLIDELSALRTGSNVASRNRTTKRGDDNTDLPRYVSKSVDSALTAQVQQWIDLVESNVKILTQNVGLENETSKAHLAELEALSDQGRKLAEQLSDHNWAAAIIRTSYSLQRRVEVWTAIQACLGSTSIGLTQPDKVPHATKAEVVAAIDGVEQVISTASDRQGWRKYLLLDQLKTWASAEDEQWRTGNQLARSFLSRIYWGRLDDKQRTVLNNDSITRLAECLTSWGRDPVDYRHLLMTVEQIEQEPTNRLVYNLADTVQILRHAESKPQRQLAETMNTHYRNANLRLTVSQKLVDLFLPEEQYEVRPVRQRILGADTAGDSAIQTELDVKFHPDPNAWNVELGVRGNVVSNTQSSKGPATFHNMGTAHVDSQRFLRMSPTGYSLSSQPAQVNSNDQLQKMSTDFDGLPVVGDFVRMMVREQFNQKRGLARRITERIIARETDAEIDRKLAESLQKAEKELNDRIMGPLQRLNLDPMVVSMSTTKDRLAIRYRLAHEMQLGAHTARPRAPSECLTSFQMHQTVLNNAIDKIGLSGKDWRLRDLYQSIGKVFQSEWAPPAEVPEDITVRFADHRPITVEMEDGKMRLHLRIAKFQRDQGLNINNFVVTSTYIPVAEGLNAGLVRDPDGTIEIQSRHLPVGDRLALRVIFSKVFVSNPEIPLISEQWRNDPRAQGLAVSQLDIRDGWLAVAISEADTELATEVADRSRAAKNVVR
jgi:hypothetical protein